MLYLHLTNARLSTCGAAGDPHKQGSNSHSYFTILYGFSFLRTKLAIKLFNISMFMIILFFIRTASATSKP